MHATKPPPGWPRTNLPVRQPRKKSEWMGQPTSSRAHWTEGLFVPYPKVADGLDKFTAKARICAEKACADVVMVFGPTGSGKTTLAEELAFHIHAAFWRVDPEKSIVPVIRLEAPDPCTPKELCLALLTALGDTNARARPKADLKMNTVDLMRKCEVRVVLFDNFQDVPAKRASRGVNQVLVRLRELIDKSQCLWVFLGTKEAQDVLNSDEQMIRRAPYELPLEYFSIAKPAQNKLYIDVLGELDAWVPVAERTDLVSLAGYIYIATEGIIDRIVKLLDAAWRSAVEMHREVLLKEDFQSAFDFVYGAHRANPFAPGFTMRRLHKPGDPFQVLKAE